MLQKRIKKVENEMVKRPGVLEVLVNGIKDEVLEGQESSKALENRVGILEAKEIASKEII